MSINLTQLIAEIEAAANAANASTSITDLVKIAMAADKVGGGFINYDSAGALPTGYSDYLGMTAYRSDTQAIYVYNGNQWDIAEWVAPAPDPTPVWEFNANQISLSQTKIIGGQSLLPATVTTHTWSNDGTRFYLYLSSSNGGWYQWNLTDPWNLNTASYFGTTGNANYPGGLGFKFNATGTEMYYPTGLSVKKRTLSTPWEITTGLGAPVTVATTSANNNAEAEDIQLSYDGTKLLWAYGGGTGVEGMTMYTLTTPFDFSTMVWDGFKYLFFAQHSNNARDISSVAMNPLGTKIYAIAGYDSRILSFTMPTPFDLSSIVPANLIGNTSAQNSATRASRGIYITPDAKYLFTCSGEFQEGKMRRYNTPYT